MSINLDLDNTQFLITPIAGFIIPVVTTMHNWGTQRLSFFGAFVETFFSSFFPLSRPRRAFSKGNIFQSTALHCIDPEYGFEENCFEFLLSIEISQTFKLFNQFTPMSRWNPIYVIWWFWISNNLIIALMMMMIIIIIMVMMMCEGRQKKRILLIPWVTQSSIPSPGA